MDKSQYIIDEVIRQGSVQFEEFENALDFAKEIDQLVGDNALAVFLMTIAQLVDPDTNQHLYNGPNIRKSEVGFLSGGSASSARNVQRHFDRWCNILTFEVNDFGGNIFEYFDGDDRLVDQYVMHLLQIHPWADGNGRTASIFRNWCLQTLDDPSPLPDYFQ